MNQDPQTGASDPAPLNPALKRRTDTTFETERVTPAPIDTASSREGEGEGWPWIWLLVTAACVAVTIYLLV
ncbi:hypothetical protein CAL18_02865 [Bordetella genomosp. 7]|uniref:hypothetical protein n=1 Tax=Bordetella genomosp. 7 TaxID=1416805 RepID=UPI000B9ED403|nr:hypothetical protein [Bordetella genomosp. 7]OZI28323.1 hypothetical protein CAL18_02865 [Bordetella genomosp. 7]